jgi:hypothetical protein
VRAIALGAIIRCPTPTLGASYMARVESFPKATEERVERTPIVMIYVRG